jgi:hypothetical protein
MSAINNDAIRDRIQRLIDYEGISQAEFATKIGKDKSYFSRILSGARAVPRGFCESILDAYDNVNKEWLIFGEGNMFDDAYEKMVNDMRPRMPMNVSGRHISDYLEGTMRVMCDERPVIKQFPDYDFTLVLKNDSMAPKYERGDEIALKKLSVIEYSRNASVIDTKSIEWGHDYLIDTCSHGPRFKKLYEKGNYFLLRSYDSDGFPDFLVPKSDVCAIYRVVGMIRV